jgi:hypothetical protein
MELEFIENWDMGSFEDNYWTTEGTNWSINGQEGQPAPAAEFTWDPAQENYSIALESFPISTIGMTEGTIWLDYDLKLDSFQPTGQEMLNVEVWNWDSQVWNTVAVYSNYEGSFDWTSEHINIKSYAMGMGFQVRFVANGANSLNILSWFIDNIDIYRACEAPYDLIVGQTQESVVLEWTSPYGPPWIPDWINWDDGMNSGNSFGTGSPLEFDCAARWEPEQLYYWEGAYITQIAFFPAESDATYSVRLWKGENAAESVVNMVVEYPVIGQWNTVTLYYPVSIDITQELWIGYHVSAQTGYPAGVDDGPAIEGYGNMINLGSWQPLQMVYPEYDVNWNIAAHLDSKTGSRWLSGYNVYRSEDNEEYTLLDYTTETTYIDDDLPGPDQYCYKVSAVWESESDMCESDFTNEECSWVGIESPYPDASFNLYPNPATENITISLSNSANNLQSGDMQFTIYNSLGKELLKENISNKTFNINLETFPSGIYWITVCRENKIEGAGKFVISR